MALPENLDQASYDIKKAAILAVFSLAALCLPLSFCSANGTDLSGASYTPTPDPTPTFIIPDGLNCLPVKNPNSVTDAFNLDYMEWMSTKFYVIDRGGVSRPVSALDLPENLADKLTCIPKR